MTTLPKTITIDGIPYTRDFKPNRIKFWYMCDDFSFIKLHGTNLLDIVDQAKAAANDHPWGMLCPVIVMEDDTEVKRVGPSVHSRPDRPQQWNDGLIQWMTAIQQDHDVVALLTTNAAPESTEEGA